MKYALPYGNGETVNYESPNEKKIRVDRHISFSVMYLDSDETTGT